jgi:hypothetical protein
MMRFPGFDGVDVLMIGCVGLAGAMLIFVTGRKPPAPPLSCQQEIDQCWAKPDMIPSVDSKLHCERMTPAPAPAPSSSAAEAMGGLSEEVDKLAASQRELLRDYGRLKCESFGGKFNEHWECFLGKKLIWSARGTMEKHNGELFVDPAWGHSP